MTDSLHRACPARFSGSDLSRPPPPNPPPRAGEGWVGACRTAPQPHCNFKPSPAAMQGFSAGGRSAPRQARPPGDHPRCLLTFSTDLPASVCDTRPFAGARPHGHPPLSLRPPYGGLFLCWAASAAALFLCSFGPSRSALSQLRLGRRIGDIAFRIDRPRFFGAVSGGRGQPVHRAIPVEIERIVAPTLPRFGLGAGAARVARFGRARERKKPFSCHIAETDRRPVRSVPGFSGISAIVNGGRRNSETGTCGCGSERNSSGRSCA